MKQKTLQTQYNLIREGKGNKETFLKEAKRIFPNYIPNAATFTQAELILKQKSIISENLWGVTTGKTEQPDWFAIFNENITEEVKAEEKKTSKEVTDLQDKNFDYKDKKNVDNVYGEAFLKGYYIEMKDPKNVEKTIDEVKDIVAKNLAKDQLHYVKNGQFGIKDLGYTDEAPGLKASKSDKMEKVKLSENREMGMGMITTPPINFNPNAKSKIEVAYDILKGAGLSREEIKRFISDNQFGKGRIDDLAKEYVNSLRESKQSLKEYTDDDFSGKKLLDKVYSNHLEDYEAFEEFFPNGVASEQEAVRALKAHDESPVKHRMGRYAPMFAHVQYHEFEDQAGEMYRVHQTQYYNSNFEKQDPQFNPNVTALTLFKLADPNNPSPQSQQDLKLGTILVKTDAYLKDLKFLAPNIKKRSMEESKVPSLLELIGEGEEKKMKKAKKETVDSKLAEIDKQAGIVALEAKIEAVAEMIESKSQRIALISEDDDLSEMMDKTKIKAIQKEIKILEKKKAQMEKLYEKSCGKRYQQQEIVDETLEEESEY